MVQVTQQGNFVALRCQNINATGALKKLGKLKSKYENQGAELVASNAGINSIQLIYKL